jgi:hypothetical protein
MNSIHSSWSNIFIAHIKRDILTNSRSLLDLISIVGFMILIIILFPLGLGPIKEKLNVVSNAVIWVGLILAIIPSLEKLLQKDFENGWLDQIATSPTQITAFDTTFNFSLIGPSPSGNNIIIKIIKPTIEIKSSNEREFVNISLLICAMNIFDQLA